jgi:hypothetical protein
VAIYEALDAVPYGIEEGADHQGGDYRAQQGVCVHERDQK